MRIDSNALQVIRALEFEIATLRLPDGASLIPTYDRSELILGSVDTLTDTLIQQAASRRSPPVLYGHAPV